ncbi:dihydrofolate reductase family protein [Glycocaulis sp.]
MAKITYGTNLSLDGYIDHEAFAPGPEVFRHWIDHVKSLTGSVYGRIMYETMRYWDETHHDWTPEQHEFADAWRRMPKWVVSRTLKSVGPNATLISDDPAALVRRLKAEKSGQITVSGSKLAGSLAGLGLIDEYRLYYHPIALGGGKPFFTEAHPRMRLIAADEIGDSVVRLTYAPA